MVSLGKVGLASVATFVLLLVIPIVASAEGHALLGPTEVGGQFPPNGGMALIAWGGGTPAQLPARAAVEGCDMRSIWATRQGKFQGYSWGSPDFVNKAFLNLYPGGEIPSGRSPARGVRESGRTLGPCTGRKRREIVRVWLESGGHR